jgi:T5orf172 domain
MAALGHDPKFGVDFGRPPRTLTTCSEGDISLTSKGTLRSNAVSIRTHARRSMQLFASPERNGKNMGHSHCSIVEEQATLCEEGSLDVPKEHLAIVKKIARSWRAKIRPDKQDGKLKDAQHSRIETSTAIASVTDASLSIDTVTTTKTVTIVPVNQLENDIKSKNHIFKFKLFIILPLDICTRLEADPKRCVASMSSAPFDRCRYKSKSRATKSEISQALGIFDKCPIAGASLKEVNDLLNEAILCEIHRKSATRALRDSKFVGEVEKLEQELATSHSNLACARQARLRLQALQLWSNRILGKESPGVAKDLSINAIQSTESSALGYFLDGEIEQVTSLRSQRQSTDEKLKVLEGIATQLHNFNIKHFKPFSSTPKFKKMTWEEEIKTKVRQPLTGHEIDESGYAYAFTFDNPSYAGRYKIGISKGPTKRVNGQWGKHHGLTPQIIFDESKSTGPLPHSRRLEKLIFAELRDCRIKMVNCQDCDGKNHREWFHTSPERAIAVIKKWSEWMRTGPYKPENFKLYPDNDTEDAIRELCIPARIPEISQTEVSSTQTSTIEATIKSETVTTQITEIKTARDSVLSINEF